MRQLLLLFAVSAVLSLTFSASLNPDKSLNGIDSAPAADFKKEILDNINDVFDSDDDDDDDIGEDIIDPETEVDGIKLGLLTPSEQLEILEDDDLKTQVEIDLDVALRVVNARSDKNRKKRWVPIALRAAAALFRASRFSRVTTSGSRITRQYNMRGNYNNAVRDFNRFRPSNQSSFNGRISGQTGQVGRHRITVRDGSSSGRPTLEIRSPRAGGGTTVRKFRYNN